MCGWPPACTSGFTRIETPGRAPPRPTVREASSSRTSSSASDSMLNSRIPRRSRRGCSCDLRSTDTAARRGFLRASCRRRKTRCDRRERRSFAVFPTRRPKRCRNRSRPSRMFQNRKITVRLHRETERMRQRTQAAMQFRLRVVDRRAAVDIRRRTGLFSDIDKPHAFAGDSFRDTARTSLLLCFFQEKCGVNVAGSTNANFFAGAASRRLIAP